MGRPDRVQICPGREQLPDSEVRLCSEKQTPESVVRICKDKCEDVGELTITGPSGPSNGTKYSAYGGLKPYSWSVSGGASIDENGTISDVSAGCGTGVVTVTDACGNAASMSFKYPTGVWVEVNYQTCSGTSVGSMETCFEGVFKYEYLMNLFGTEDTCPIPVSCWDEERDNGYFWMRTYAWQCP